MKPLLITFLLSSLAIAIGNFLSQFSAKVPQWWVALDRTLYQLVALIVFILIFKCVMKAFESHSAKVKH